MTLRAGKRRLEVTLRAVSVRRGDQWVLRDIDWRLEPGERWALLGANGAGKTQLLKLLSGDIWPTPTAESSPAPATGGRTYRSGSRTIDLQAAKRRMAYVGGERQDNYARYGWNLRVRDVVATGLHASDLLLRPITARQARRVRDMLLTCGLQALALREFLSLSYGEKRLVLLARALVSDPDWLLLDEFYNGLDRHYRRRIDAVLAAARRRGQSWVATAHRAADVPRGTSRILELAAGRVCAVKPMRRAVLDDLARRAGERAAGTIRAGRTAPGARPAGSTPAGSTPAGSALKVSPSEPAAPRRGEVLLELMGVDLYVDYRLVLREVNWQLRRGQHWAVYGANGAGKSSFLKLLYGDLAPALGGRLVRAGLPAGTPISEWKRRIGFVSPELQTEYLVDVSVLELVASGRHSSIGLIDAMTPRETAIARRWLEFFGLLAVAQRRPRELSYGQLRRALMARAMVPDPHILLLDEPLTGLDPEQRSMMKELLGRLMRRAVTLIAAVHHPEDLPPGMTHALRLQRRRARQLVS